MAPSACLGILGGVGLAQTSDTPSRTLQRPLDGTPSEGRPSFFVFQVRQGEPGPALLGNPLERQEPTPAQARQLLGYLPEQVPLYTDMRVREFLTYRARIKGLSRKEARSRVDYVIERAFAVSGICFSTNGVRT